jgi:hypothetical protein
VLWIRSRRQIPGFLGLPDPDPSLFCTDPDLDPDPFINTKKKKNLPVFCERTIYRITVGTVHNNEKRLEFSDWIPETFLASNVSDPGSQKSLEKEKT